MRRLTRYVARRLLFVIPQLLGVITLVFILLRLLPGDPAYVIAGPVATPENIASIRQNLGLDKPILTQYFIYLKGLARGDLGRSWFTGNPVLVDIAQRLPATLELITIGMVLALLIMVPLGILTSVKTGRILNRIAERVVFAYGMLAGALPDFWLALILVFVFYYTLRWFPPPMGRIDIGVEVPRTITGMLTVDSLLTGNWPALRSSLAHLALPVVTLVFVYGGPVLKMTRMSMTELDAAGFVSFSKACGIPTRKVMRQMFRNSLASVITIVGLVYGYLLGGAVLVETVFGWGGLGQYAVQSFTYADFAPMQGFVLVAALFLMLVNLIVDMVYFISDPRVSI